MTVFFKTFTPVILLLTFTACGGKSGSYLGNQTEPSKLLSLNKTNLDVPYYCQMDNRVEKHATCSNSSLAMVLDFNGTKSIGSSGNLADQLYNKFGKLNSVAKIASTAQSLGYKAETRVPSSFSQIKRDLDKGLPVIIGGDFVGRAGHFIVAKGYNETGFVVHDPYGDWDRTTISPGNGYGSYLCNNGYSGENKVYTYSQMHRAAGPGFWTVTISK